LLLGAVIVALVPLVLFLRGMIKSETADGRKKYMLRCLLVAGCIVAAAIIVPVIWYYFLWAGCGEYRICLDVFGAVFMGAVYILFAGALSLVVLVVRLVLYWRAKGELTRHWRQYIKVVVGLFFIGAVLFFYVGLFLLFRWWGIPLRWYFLFFIVTFFMLWHWYSGWVILRE